MQEDTYIVTFQDNDTAIEVERECYSVEGAQRYQDWLTAQGQESKLFLRLYN